MADKESGEDILRAILEKGSDKAKKDAADVLSSLESVPVEAKAKRTRKSLGDLVGKIGKSNYYRKSDGTVVDETGKAVSARLQDAFYKSQEIQKAMPKAPRSLGVNKSKQFELSLQKSIVSASKVAAASDVAYSKIPNVLEQVRSIANTLYEQNQITVRNMIKKNEEFRDAVIEQLTGVKGPTKAGGAVARARKPSAAVAVSGSRAAKITETKAKIAKATAFRETRPAEVRARAARIARIRATRNVALTTGAVVGGAAVGAGVGLGVASLLGLSAPERAPPSAIPPGTIPPGAPTPRPPPAPGGPQITRSGSEESLLSAAKAAGITDKTELAQFMAQMAHESGNFRYLQEIWGPTPAQQRYEGRRDLGNTQSGDGYRYRGRGYVQLTGRANYATFGSMIGVDLVSDPDLASQPDIAAKLAIAYWNTRVKPKVTNFEDTRTVTRLINGGYNGLDDRASKFARYNAQPDLATRTIVAGTDTGAPTTAPSLPQTGAPPPIGRPPPSPAAPAVGTGGVGRLAGPGGQQPSNVSLGPNVDLSGVDPDLLQKFYQAASEYGGPVRINSAYRDDSYQAQLWVRANILREPGIYSPARPRETTTITYKGQQYTVPGGGKGSAHASGRALDISPAEALDPYLRKYGLHRPFASFDPPHVTKIGGESYESDTDVQTARSPERGSPAPVARAAVQPSMMPQQQMVAMSRQTSTQNFFDSMMGVQQPVIVNNTRMVNTTRTIYQQPSYVSPRGRGEDFNPLTLAGVAAGVGIVRALRLF